MLTKNAETVFLPRVFRPSNGSGGPNERGIQGQEELIACFEQNEDERTGSPTAGQDIFNPLCAHAIVSSKSMVRTRENIIIASSSENNFKE